MRRDKDIGFKGKREEGKGEDRYESRDTCVKAMRNSENSQSSHAYARMYRRS